jgi:hypothetical protein
VNLGANYLQPREANVDQIAFEFMKKTGTSSGVWTRSKIPRNEIPRKATGRGPENLIRNGGWKQVRMSRSIGRSRMLSSIVRS